MKKEFEKDMVIAIFLCLVPPIGILLLDKFRRRG